ETVATIGERERAVARDRGFQPVTLALIQRLKVSYLVLASIVCLVRRKREMDLPQVFEPRNALDRVPSGNWPTLRRSVVYHYDLRLDSQHKCRSSGTVVHKAMVGGLEESYGSELVHWACKFHFLIPREITEIQKLESSICQQD